MGASAKGTTDFPLGPSSLAGASIQLLASQLPSKAYSARFDEERFPALPPGTPARPVYFERLTPTDRAVLFARGYAPKLLMELPRGTPAAEQDYLLAKAQALEEGTCPGGKVEREAV